MRLGWIVLAGAALGALPAGATLAQDQPPYETPRYQPRQPTAVDRNYGLPSFGMPGAELPQQKPTATAPDASAVPDFFANTTEIPLPKVTTAPAAAKDAETPMFTTSDGSTLASTSVVPNDSDTSSDDTTEAQKVQSR